MKLKLLIDKFKTKQFGVFLIMVGIFIPLILYPFTTVESTTLLFQLQAAQRGGSYNAGLQSLEIVIGKGSAGKDNRVAVSYKYPLSFGILLVFIGGCFVVFGKKGNVIYL